MDVEALLKGRQQADRWWEGGGGGGGWKDWVIRAAKRRDAAARCSGDSARMPSFAIIAMMKSSRTKSAAGFRPPSHAG